MRQRAGTSGRISLPRHPDRQTGSYDDNNDSCKNYTGRYQAQSTTYGSKQHGSQKDQSVDDVCESSGSSLTQ